MLALEMPTRSLGSLIFQAQQVGASAAHTYPPSCISCVQPGTLALGLVCARCTRMHRSIWCRAAQLLQSALEFQNVVALGTQVALATEAGRTLADSEEGLPAELYGSWAWRMQIALQVWPDTGRPLVTGLYRVAASILWPHMLRYPHVCGTLSASASLNIPRAIRLQHRPCVLPISFWSLLLREQRIQNFPSAADSRFLAASYARAFKNREHDLVLVFS